MADDKDAESKPFYDPKTKPMAEAIVKAIASLGIDLWESEAETASEKEGKAEITADPHKAMLMGYLAGFEAALHVAICGSGGPDVVKMLAMSMDQDIHDGATPFHDLAEDLLAAIKQAMLITAVSSEDIDFGVKGFVIDATGKTPEEVTEEIRLRATGLVAKMMPKKDKDDA